MFLGQAYKIKTFIFFLFTEIHIHLIQVKITE